MHAGNSRSVWLTKGMMIAGICSSRLGLPSLPVFQCGPICRLCLLTEQIQETTSFKPLRSCSTSKNSKVIRRNLIDGIAQLKGRLRPDKTN